MDKKFIELAIGNITKFGDTDIFPFPIENHVFFDSKEKVIELIQAIDANHQEHLNNNPPNNINTVSPLGYVGFRWATLVDPVWNCFLLSKVLSIGEQIEASRIDKTKRKIHSYRLLPNLIDHTLFDTSYNWRTFQEASLEISKSDSISHIVVCDIADFYSRVYHHRIENALKQVDSNASCTRAIMDVLKYFSDNKSYGLPIGGEAARILAELVLNSVDRLLTSKGILFTRFVDDYHIFCKSNEEAHANLNELSIKLMTNEGLTLQKHKTQILTKSEFNKLVGARIGLEEEDGINAIEAKFMSLPIRYDPYSATPESDYKKIKDELSKFDLLSLLNSELRKSRIHQQLGRQLLKSLKFIEDTTVSYAFIAISDRLEVLYPIFPNVMIAAHANYQRLSSDAKESLFKKLITLIDNNSYILQVEMNASYAIKVLGNHNSEMNQQAILELHKRFSNSVLVRTLVMAVMIKWNLYWWLSDQKMSFKTMSDWEKRMFIIASYRLLDEGSHWRQHVKKSLSTFESIVLQWASQKIPNSNYEFPI